MGRTIECLLSRRTKFTLVEMLVVIAIISILAAMLSPALKKAYEQALALDCTSQMKQIQTGSRMYTDDNDGWLLPVRLSWDTPLGYQFWPYIGWTYLTGKLDKRVNKAGGLYGDNSLGLYCKRFPSPFVEYSRYTFSYANYFTYKINPGVGEFVDKNTMVKDAAVKRPSKAYNFTESYKDAWKVGGWWESAGSYPVCIHGNSSIYDFSTNGTAATRLSDLVNAQRVGNYAIASFFDGHANKIEAGKFLDDNLRADLYYITK